MNAADALVAALADRYRIERELGAGGMATVYLAHDVKHDRNVAIKVLRPELAAVIGAERFLSEIKTTANLQHPHILPLHDSGEADGFLFYVMPFVEGETVRDRLKREKQLPISDALRIATQVASALDYAHRHGVIHRDIKPENILLHDGSALVADFGIALAASKAGGTRMTETGMSLGTPHYMSPEQAMGEREITARADVYALGCVLYEMLLGEPPFTGPTAQSIVSKVLSEKPASLVGRRERVPVYVEDAVLTALEKLPADRFGTASEFADALQGSSRGAAAGERAMNARATRVRQIAWAIPIAVVAITSGFFAGRRTGALAANSASEWTVELLGGPRVALGPRVSPDGQFVAFQAMVDGQTQVGVLKPQSGDWTLLTSDRTKGSIGDVAWSRDNSRIYFSRFFELPVGIYSISPLGTGERLVLENAGHPAPLADGSLLVSRVNADRDLQMYHFWPATGRMDTLPATRAFFNGTSPFFCVFPDGREAAFIGNPAGVRDSTPHLYAIDLTTKRIRRLAPGIDVPFAHIMASPDGRSVVVSLTTGNAHQFVAIPRDGSSGRRLLAQVTGDVNQIDIDRDANLYVDQGFRSTELRRFDPVTKRAETWPIPSSQFANIANLLPLPDGRVLFAVPTSGGTRVLAMLPGSQPQSFVAAEQETNAPFALLGQDRVALVLGSAADATVAIASIATGQITTRFAGVRPTQMAASVDGATLYFVQSNAVWAVPSTGGEKRKVRDGDAIAVDPHGRFLVIEHIGKTQVRLFRVPLDGGAEEEIVLHSEMRLAPLGLLAPNAIHPDGRIAVTVASPASWFWPTAILDPRTGTLEIVPPGLLEDTYGGWDNQSRLVYTTQGQESSLWRFRPSAAKDAAR